MFKGTAPSLLNPKVKPVGLCSPMKNLLHGGNAHWSAPTITHFSSFEIGDATVFTVPLDLDKKLSDFHKQFPLYNVAAMTQIERQSITEALTCIGYGYRNG